MSAKIIDGKLIANETREFLKSRVNSDNPPCLAVILIGNNPASVSYVKGKEKACEELGIKNIQINLPDFISEEELINEIKKLNDDKTVNGILVQLPLPKHLNTKVVIDTISPEKDVDGFTTENVGRMILGREHFTPCTPLGILKILEHENISTVGKHVVVIGRSDIVGRPIANLLSQKPYDATVTICHSKTDALYTYTKTADIVIVATGKPDTIYGHMLKPGCVVIDVGVNRVEDPLSEKGYRLIGDVNFKTCETTADYITPVPGGVGPMTITMLLQNTLKAKSIQESSNGLSE